MANAPTLDPFTGVQVRVGVMGSAAGALEGPVGEICRAIAAAVAAC